MNAYTFAVYDSNGYQGDQVILADSIEEARVLVHEQLDQMLVPNGPLLDDYYIEFLDSDEDGILD